MELSKAQSERNESKLQSSFLSPRDHLFGSCVSDHEKATERNNAISVEEKVS